MQDILNQIPNNKIISVLSSYRTGSTSFCKWLSDSQQRINCDEHFHLARKPWKPVPERAVIKIMPDTEVPDWFLVEDTYKIKLKRKDFVAQATSWYIAMVRNLWHPIDLLNPEYVWTTNPVDIIDKKIDEHYEYMEKMCKIQDSWDFDMTLYLEDIQDNLPYSRYLQCKNYKEVYELMTIRSNQLNNYNN